MQTLIKAAGLNSTKIDTQAISFQIAPRINAAGRMDHANAAFSLLTTNSRAEAEELSRALNLTNLERQKLTDTMVMEAKEQIGQINDRDYFVHAFRKNWPLGLVGLVAGKLVQIYNRPALVMCQSDDKIAGSGRAGVADFDLALALTKCENLLISYGGHKEAAGFSLKPDNFEIFLRTFAKRASEQLKGVDLTPVINIDILLSLKDLNLALSELITALEPYGQGNSRPRFATLASIVRDISTVGTTGQHLRLQLEQNGFKQTFIWFNVNDNSFRPAVGDMVDVVYELAINDWHNMRRMELKLIDIRASESNK